MPIVQRLNRRVGESAIPGVSIPVESSKAAAIEAGAFEALGRGLSEIGRAKISTETRLENEKIRAHNELLKQQEKQAEILRKERKKEREEKEDLFNKQTALTAANKLNSHINELNSTVLQAEGEEARGVSEKYRKALEKNKSDVLNTLTTPKAKLLFESKIFDRYNSALDRAIKYEDDTLDKFYASQAEVSIQDSVVLAIEKKDPAAVDLAIDDIDLSLSILKADAATKRDKRDAAISEIHTGIIQEYLTDGNTEQAKKHFDKNKMSINSKDRKSLAKDISTVAMKKDIINTADSITLVTKDEAERAEKIKSIKDLDKRAAVKKLVDADTAALKAQKKAQDENIKSVFKQAVLEAPTYKDAFEIIEEHASIAEVDNLGNFLEDLYGIANARMQRESKEKVETDPVKLNEARKLINSGEITTEAELIPYKLNVNDKDYKGLQDFLTQGGSVGDLNYGTIQQAFKSVTGISPDADVVLFDDIYRIIEHDIRASGATPTYDALRGIIRKAVISGDEVRLDFYDPNDEWFSSWPWHEKVEIGKEISGINYMQAVQRGTVDKWLPDLTDNEKSFVARDMRRQGLLSDNELFQRLYYKKNIMGEPLSDTQEDAYKALLSRTGKMIQVTK